MFEANGFDFADAPDGGLLLTAVPFSKEVVFGEEDVLELAAMLAEGSGTSSQPVPRPSKVGAMLAMRACKSSITMGKPLDHARMKRLLAGLSELRAPWSCAHGRPTLRHLCVLPQATGEAAM